VSKSGGSLDTNVILRIILGDIPNQSEAAKKLISNPQFNFVVSDLAIVKVEYALRANYKFSRKQVLYTLGSFLMLPAIKSNLKTMQRAFQAYILNPKLSFTDCCLATRAEFDEATPLWTFDIKLAKGSPNNTHLVEV
jgi:predicted nucleic acid-binding protein